MTVPEKTTGGPGKKNGFPSRPLLSLKGRKPSAPEWFAHSLAVPSQEVSVSVSGTDVAFSVWGQESGQDLLLVHGRGAHRNWWRPFAPYLARGRKVAALDLSGAGDSGWRTRYDMDLFVDELFAVIDAAGLSGPQGKPVIAGHSFGGVVTLAAALREGERLEGAVIIDSPFGTPVPGGGGSVVRSGRQEAGTVSASPPKCYASFSEPVSRFRFVPAQPVRHLFLADYIAREGLRRVATDDGARWTWKFDPSFMNRLAFSMTVDFSRKMQCPLGFIYGEKSCFSTGTDGAFLREQIAGRYPLAVIPEAFHHLMMDQPAAFVASLGMLLSFWALDDGLASGQGIAR